MSVQDSSVEVSVIIPTHNCLAYLPAAIACVEIQKVDNLELIIIEDGSTDDSWNYLQSRAQTLPWLRLLQRNGGGPSAARNAGIEIARGHYIAFLDADDLWRAGKLAAQLAFHRAHPDVVLSFTDYLHVDPDGVTHGTCYEYWPRFQRAMAGQKGYRVLPNNALAMIFAENVVGTSTAMMRRDVLLRLGGFDRELHSAEDWELWLKLADAGPVGCTDGVDVDYLIRRPGSITRNSNLRLSCMQAVMARFGDRVAQQDPSARKFAEARYAICAAEYARESKNWSQALQCHLSALAKVPSKRTARAAASDGLKWVRSLMGG